MERFDPATTALLDAHQHPLRKELDLLRRIILGADTGIEEGVKWNTASYRTHEWFATLNGPKQVKAPMVILHAGAKAKGIVLKDRITDPEGLLTWMGNDRAQILFRGHADMDAQQKVVQAIIRAWVKHV
jgi:hypothetical protein